MIDLFIMWISTISTILFFMYTWADIKGHISYTRGNSNQLWFNGLLFGTIITVILYTVKALS